MHDVSVGVQRSPAAPPTPAPYRIYVRQIIRIVDSGFAAALWRDGARPLPNCKYCAGLMKLLCSDGGGGGARST